MSALLIVRREPATIEGQWKQLPMERRSRSGPERSAERRTDASAIAFLSVPLRPLRPLRSIAVPV